jgi:hypothetical protein
MPWLETSSVNERARFIAADRRGLYTRAELCTRYGISRKTGYKWLGRFAEDGRRGLQDRSHAPHPKAYDAIMYREPYAVRGRTIGFLPEAAVLAGAVVALGAIWAAVRSGPEVLIGTAIGARGPMAFKPPKLVPLPVRLRIRFMFLQRVAMPSLPPAA